MNRLLEPVVMDCLYGLLVTSYKDELIVVRWKQRLQGCVAFNELICLKNVLACRLWIIRAKNHIVKRFCEIGLAIAAPVGHENEWYTSYLAIGCSVLSQQGLDGPIRARNNFVAAMDHTIDVRKDAREPQGVSLHLRLTMID